MSTIEFKVQLSILKPVEAVFDAVVSPEKLSGYFVSSATGPMKQGAEVIWRFPEMDIDVKVRVTEIVPNQCIRFDWEGEEPGHFTHVEIVFESLDAHTTMVSIEETGWRPNEDGVRYSYRNCGGWMHMACCLKAYLEYGINLRKGSFTGIDVS